MKKGNAYASLLAKYGKAAGKASYQTSGQGAGMKEVYGVKEEKGESKKVRALEKKTGKEVGKGGGAGMCGKGSGKGAGSGKKNWIAGAIKKPGALHKALGVKQGQKIPAKKLAAASKKAKSGSVMQKRLNLAKTLKSFKK